MSVEGVGDWDGGGREGERLGCARGRACSLVRVDGAGVLVDGSNAALSGLSKWEWSAAARLCWGVVFIL